MSRPNTFRIAVRKYGPFESAIAKQWASFDAEAHTGLTLEAVAMDLHPLEDALLTSNGMSLGDFKGFLFHPGGRKVLETAEEVLAIDRSVIAHSWDVLRDFGNMSSATALFILQRAMQAGDKGRHLLAAFGPGFSAYFVALDL